MAKRRKQIKQHKEEEETYYIVCVEDVRGNKTYPFKKRVKGLQRGIERCYNHLKGKYPKYDIIRTNAGAYVVNKFVNPPESFKEAYLYEAHTTTIQ